MIIGRVTAPLVATAKHPFFAGRKLLLVHEILENGTLAPKPIIALDGVQAGVGDMVLVAKNGGAVDDVLGTKDAPANQIIIAIVERVERQG